MLYIRIQRQLAAVVKVHWVVGERRSPPTENGLKCFPTSDNL